MTTIRVGMAAVDFTPPVGLPLMGNVRQDYAAVGTHDPLVARAFAVAGHSGTCVILLVLDLCMITREQTAWMRERIARRCDIPTNNILISATHTHSGPATKRLYSSPSAPEQRITAFLRRASEAAIAAHDDLRPASLWFGTADERSVSFCRRLRGRDGRIHMNWELPSTELIVGPTSEIDPQVRVLGIDRDGAASGMLVNFSLHPAIIGFADNRYSADYPGALVAALKQSYGPDFHGAFSLGCCADINHIDLAHPPVPGDEYTVAERIGTRLAQVAADTASHGSRITGTPIYVSSEYVPLKRLPVDEQTYRWALETCERLAPEGAVSEIHGISNELSASTWVDMYRCQREVDYVEVMVIRLGELAIVGFPGEMFCEFQRRLIADSPSRYTMCIELAGDAIGYLPTPEAFAAGGYEATPGATLYQPEAGELLTASALRQLQHLFAS